MAASGVDRLRDWVALFLLGTINNLPYVVVNSSALILASSFDKENYVPLIMFSNVAFGLLGGGLSTTLTLIKIVPFWVQFLSNGFLMIGGLVIVAFAPNFWIALIGILMCGMSSSFGENTTLGYLHTRRKTLINAWSSGTGFAGITGAGLYILLTCVASVTVVSGNNSDLTEKLKHMNKFAFLSTLPVVLIYWFAYFILLTGGKEVEGQEVVQGAGLRSRLHTQPVKVAEEKEGGVTVQGSGEEDNVSCDSGTGEDVPLVRGEGGGGGGVGRGRYVVRRVLRCTKLVLWLALNLSSVYVFEYMARGAASRARPKDEYNEGSCPELFASLQLCYQAGVFVSRSSLGVIKIRRVEILSVLQLVNMIVWVLLPVWHFLPVYVLPGYMIYVGLLGGAAYVNIFYLLRTDPKFPSEDRRLCINLTQMSITIGILTGTILEFATLNLEKAT